MPLENVETVLAIGFGLARPTPSLRGPRVVTAEFEELSPALIAQHDPDLVLAPLIAPRFDAVELAERLAACRYMGDFLIVTRNVPRPDIIRRELRGAVDPIRVEIISTDEIEAALIDALPSLAAG